MNLYNRMINGTSAPEDLVEMIKRFEDPRINEAVLKIIRLVPKEQIDRAVDKILGN